MTAQQELGWGALAVLALAGALCGTLARVAMRRLADQTKLDRVKGLLAAHLLEFRLFGDEPAQVWRAQRDVARQAWRMMRLVALPALVVTLPMVFVFTRLEAVFGWAALPPGEATVVTASWDGRAAPRLEGAGGWVVETPAVREPGARQVSWRVRAQQAGLGELKVTSNGEPQTVPVFAGAGPRYGSAFMGSDAAAVQYPPAVVIGLPWTVWFFAFAAAAYFTRPI
ncbi:MAG: hypothetical protein IT162_16700 [Bryobacterales bacterium]|nr:hypothetical protein [Bryobacterales bacterium]